MPPRHPLNTIICYDGAVKCTTTAMSQELRATRTPRALANHDDNYTEFEKRPHTIDLRVYQCISSP